MDLLEGLDDIATQRRTFKKQIDVHAELDDEVNVETQPVSQDDNLLGFKSSILDNLLDNNTEDPTQLVTNQATQFDLFSNDIIKNVQRRLNGEIEEEEEEEEKENISQEIPTQLVGSFVTQQIGTLPVAGKTQLIPQRTQLDAGMGFGTQFVSLFKPAPIQETIEEDPQQENEDSDHEIQDQSLFLQESDVENDDQAAKDKRALKIAERAAMKRLLREQLENEKKKTAQEEDEFDELENSKIVSDTPLKTKKSKKDEKILAETRRLQREVEFIPAPSKNKRFDKSKLFEAFGFAEDLVSSSPVKITESPSKEHKSTPSTSPLATPVRSKQDISLDASSDEEIEGDNILDMLDNSKIILKQQEESKTESMKRRALNNPLRSYEERLNENAITKKGFKVIELDSDPELDTIDHLKQHTSKETKLDIKTKFVQKKKQQDKSGLAAISLNKFFPNLPTKKATPGFVASLNSKTARQLRDIMLAKKLEKNDVEHDNVKKDGLNIDDLLEREIERNIRLKKRENRRSKEKEDEAGDDDSSDASYESDDSAEGDEEPEPVAEVQVQSSFIENQSQKLESDEEEEEEEILTKVHKHHQKLLSDDEGEDSIRSTQPLNNNISFMYGANDDDDDNTHESINHDDSNDFQMGSYGSQQPNLQKMLGITMTQAFESTLPQAGKDTNIMDNLRNKQLQVIGEDEDLENNVDDKTKDSFLVDENSTFNGVANKSVSFVEPGNDEELDADFSMPLQTQKMVIGTQADDQQAIDNLGQIIKQSQNVKPLSKRRLVRKLERILQSESEEEEEEEDSESDEETRKINYAIAKEKQRQKDIRRKRKLKEWKRKGVTAIVDDEATESEDEFHGLGGADGDFSDQENSEDEKMLDDTSRVDLKANELRSKFAEEEKQRNENDVKKLFEDIKTGRLRKRRGADSLDIELSEDEEDLKNFYLSRVNKQRSRLLQNEKIASIAANEKSKAFFETIAEKPVSFKLDDDDEDEGVEEILEEDEESKQDDPFVETQPLKKKRKLKISHDYITRTLSEVCNSNNNLEEIEEKERLFAKYQHGFTDQVEDEMDLLALKKQSSVLMSNSELVQATESINNTQTIDNEEIEEFNPIRKSSIIKSFQRFNSSTTSNGVKEVEVTISKSYKSSSGSKASIGYLANKNSMSSSSALLKNGRTLKVRNIEKDLRNKDRKSSLSGVFQSGNFD